MTVWPWVLVGGVVWWLLFRYQKQTAMLGQCTVPQLPGAAGVVQTVALMRAMVNSSIADPLIRRHAVQAADHCNRSDPRCVAHAIGEWTRSRIKYVPDPLHHEHLTSPSVMATAIEEGKRVYGDCDDMAMYVAALGKSIGLQPVFQVVGRDKRFHHVYTELAGVAVDPTVSLGIKPFPAKRRMTLKV